MARLTDLPNIGPKLAGHLEQAGLSTPEAVREVGAEAAFLRIRSQADASACLHELEALAGAVEGVRKSLLPPERKAELKAWVPHTLRTCLHNQGMQDRRGFFSSDKEIFP